MAKRKVERQPFAARILDQLAELNEFEYRPMFGCLGLYSESVYFGIVCGDCLFFRVDDATRPKYIRHKMEYLEFRENQKECNYYRVPPKVVNSASQLCAWARESVDVQRGRQKAKPRRSHKAAIF